MKKVFTWMNRGKFVMKQAKERGEIMRGARAMNKQLAFGFLERGTSDFDLFSKSPKKSATLLEKALDEASGGDHYYVKAAKHKGTWKVMNKGIREDDEDDDWTVADYTKQPRGIKTVMIDGIAHVHLSERVKDIKTTLENPDAAFRHPKDRRDLERIKSSRWFK